MRSPRIPFTTATDPMVAVGGDGRMHEAWIAAAAPLDDGALGAEPALMLLAAGLLLGIGAVLIDVWRRRG
ncbi:hypothetical protein GCM10025874_14000 [Arenivirga flava]|uniref:Uncharacterized protein n=1 Tax=Arenivirga flava TaxID=1930060 RepID=A0AA37UTN2_9MICO|nr:hypothetical protein GCM10025874_14000 [Arenivirga flava]